MNDKIIFEIKKNGKTARGKKELLKHLEGGKLTLRQATLARCYDCMGFMRTESKIAKCLNARFIHSWLLMQIRASELPGR